MKVIKIIFVSPTCPLSPGLKSISRIIWPLSKLSAYSCNMAGKEDNSCVAAMRSCLWCTLRLQLLLRLSLFCKIFKSSFSFLVKNVKVAILDTDIWNGVESGFVFVKTTPNYKIEEISLAPGVASLVRPTRPSCVSANLMCRLITFPLLTN